ncbi:MAG: chemotaxis protein CheD [bacterium]
MKSDDTDLPLIYLLPGDLYIARQPAIISTILGSCISICLHAPSVGIGAMCHCLLPSSFEKERCRQPFRYVDQAIGHMLLKIEGMGVKRTSLFSQIIGGANILNTGAVSNSIGRQNIEAAKTILRACQVPIKKEDLGGIRGRKIFFYSATGIVLVKEIPSGPTMDKRSLYCG